MSFLYEDGGMDEDGVFLFPVVNLSLYQMSNTQKGYLHGIEISTLGHVFFFSFFFSGFKTPFSKHPSQNTPLQKQNPPSCLQTPLPSKSTNSSLIPSFFPNPYPPSSPASCTNAIGSSCSLTCLPVAKPVSGSCEPDIERPKCGSSMPAAARRSWSSK